MSREDPFLSVALPYILSVVMGFALVLMGFIFLALAGLSALVHTNETPAWVWLLLGLGSEGFGGFLMYRSLSDSPVPGTYGPSSKS